MNSLSAGVWMNYYIKKKAVHRHGFLAGL